jgi:hypothetical protein
MAQHAIQNNKMLEFINTVYDAALDERCWSALAAQIARAFDSTSTTIMVQEAGRPRHPAGGSYHNTCVPGMGRP